MILFKRKINYEKILVGYWFFVPILFGIYFFIMNLKNNSTIEQTLKTDNPLLAMGMLVSFLLVIQGMTFILLNRQGENSNQVKRYFLTFSIFQQLLMFNIIGSALSFLAYRQLPEKNQTKLNVKPWLLGIITFIIFLSIIIAWIQIRQLIL
ncbi:hypothetical protein [Vagococcus hydrophili]|uniref:Uncharacterized protein n=1 Tax=Vagococcus hydrophili TaxID=2714947 RepID=A0A6G8ASR4_9ENTE|nr:hypothetical protein [Vagococcus hydrophili]QIL48118.1 hypothetical protein G7082_06110 [Vagococcus hydrophili]